LESNETLATRVERGIKDTNCANNELSKVEKKMFNKIKRSLLRTFANPNHAVKMLIDIAAWEYINYARGMVNPVVTNNSRIARSITDVLSELDLTPKSKKTSEVSATLSQIFQSLNKEE